jgi:hypothetical protein
MSKTATALAVASSDLFACPFCGGPAEINDSHFFGFWRDYDVSCSMCNANLGSSYTDLKTAIARWNHRQANNYST